MILKDKLFEKGNAIISRVGSRTFTVLEKKINLLTQHLLIIECKLIIKLGSSESLGPELSCITPIIVRQVLYGTYSNLLRKISLFSLSCKISP